MLNKMSEAFSEMKDQFRERISSPLAGTFLFSWCVWNYKLLLVLIGDMSTPYKISYIENNLYELGWLDTVTLFIGPLITAIVYILVYPIIGKFFFAYSRKQQNILKDLKQQIDGESLLSEKEGKELRTEIIKANSLANNAIRDQEHMLKENERLQKELDALQKKFNELETPNTHDFTEQDSSIDDNESDNEKMFRVLKYIGMQTEDYVARTKLIKAFQGVFNKVILDHLLDKLIQVNLIKEHASSYVITKEGRAALMEVGFE